MEKKIRVALGMSGGVDSSVAAKLLQDQGYEVVGFFMKLWHDPSCDITRENACCDEKSLMDAREVADMLGIKLYVVDARLEFKKWVVDYFIEEYKNLRTPNPCIVCNEKIKFDWLLKYAEKLDCDFLTTGHYARIVQHPASGSQHSVGEFENSKLAVIPAEAGILSREKKIPGQARDDIEGVTYHLLKGKDENKDQSYFLYRLNQEQLSKILFPIGEYTKPEVRVMAKKWNLPVHEKVESQEICFIASGTYREFLQKYLPKEYFKEGDIVDSRGNIIGSHNGLINYTIGQRRGINQTASSIQQSAFSMGKRPMYVVGFNKEKNELIVGEPEELLKNRCELENIYWTSPAYSIRQSAFSDLKVKIRYRAKEVLCKASIQHSAVSIQFEEPQRAVAPGQSAVIYSGNEVIGGGVII